MQELRQHLHRFPELSGEEKHTSDFIAEQLTAMGIEIIHRDFSLYSVLAEIDSGISGKTLLFRCELDALPIEEINTFEHKSIVKGISHKCGHDGHMIIMLGLAKKLKEHKLPGKFLLLFQSAEEDGRGARSVIDSEKLKEFDIDFIFALHNIPGFPMGEIMCRPGNFTVSVESLDIRLFGKTSHAGMPERGINPATVLPDIIKYLSSLHHSDPTGKNYFPVTPIEIRLGKPYYGISAGEAVLSYTFRAWDKENLERKKSEIESGLTGIISATPLKFSFEWKLGFDANINDQHAFEIIKQAARESNYSFKEIEQPFSFGEDFGTLTQQFRGAMFGIGAGEDTPELHNPDYDFPDELHQAGVEMFFKIAINAQSEFK